jgi:hypothetical protein
MPNTTIPRYQSPAAQCLAEREAMLHAINQAFAKPNPQDRLTEIREITGNDTNAFNIEGSKKFPFLHFVAEDPTSAALRITKIEDRKKLLACALF